MQDDNKGRPNRNDDRTSASRRSLLKATGGTFGVAAGLGGAISATGVVAADHVVYDGTPRTKVYAYDSEEDDECMADVTSSVTGPDYTSYDNFRMGVEFSIPTQTLDGHTSTLVENIEIEVRDSYTPADYTIESVMLKEKSGSDLEAADKVLEYGLDALWDYTAGRVLPLPSPFGLVDDDSGASYSRSDSWEDMDVQFPDNSDVPGVSWNMNLANTGSNGSLVEGDYYMDVECRCDVGFFNTTDGGFSHVETVEHHHDVKFTVT
jgi:hypothetical protein